MPKPPSTAPFRALTVSIATVQLLDIIIHAATNQIEVMRVAANVIVLLWLAIVVSDKVRANSLGLSLKTIGLYLLLHIIFLAREGVTNTAQGGDLRIALFVFMILTVGLSVLLTLKRRKNNL